MLSSEDDGSIHTSSVSSDHSEEESQTVSSNKVSMSHLLSVNYVLVVCVFELASFSMVHYN